MLIPLHSFIYIVGNNTSSFHANPNNVPELLLIGSLAPIYLGLTACHNLCVELTAKFTQFLNLHAFCKIPKLKKFPLSRGHYCLAFPKVPSHMLACAKNLRSAGGSDSGCIACAEKSDMRMSQAGNGYCKAGRFDSSYGSLKLIEKLMDVCTHKRT
jgi:hypothetical protein